MANMSDYLENKLIDHVFRNVSYTAPTSLAVALCTAAPTDASTGATIAEVSQASSSGYTRVNLNQSTTNWAATNGATTTTNPSSGTGGTTSNNSAITFPVAGSNYNAQVTHVAILDSFTYGAGNVLFWGQLSVAKTVSTGDTFSFAISQLSVQIDN